MKELESEANKKKNYIEKLEKNLEEDKKYFDNYGENKIELEKKIKESKILSDKLINKNKKIIKELDNKKELINEYESELDN